jgi:probable HAF family extracellular repeat protein
MTSARRLLFCSVTIFFLLLPTWGQTISHAFLWSPSTGMQDLGTLGGDSCGALGINAAGHVVGWSTTASRTPHAFLWTSSGGMQDLGQGTIGSTAYAINDHDQIAGINHDEPVVWMPGGGMVRLGSFGGGGGIAYAINNAGQVVGYSDTANFQSHAFLWTKNAGMQDLGTLGGSTSVAYGINDSGEVVGLSRLPDGSTHAFLWSLSGGMQDLGRAPADVTSATAISKAGTITGYTGTLEVAIIWAGGTIHKLGDLGGRESWAFGINNANQVVGISVNASGAGHAFLWTRNGGMQDLGTLGGKESGAFAINAAGQVAGESFTSP